MYEVATTFKVALDLHKDRVGKGYPEYQEGQPRDEQGRWSGGGGAGAWNTEEGLRERFPDRRVSILTYGRGAVLRPVEVGQVQGNSGSTLYSVTGDGFTFKFTVNDGSKTIDLDWLEVPDTRQGRNEARTAIQTLLEAANDSGTEYIKLYAGLDSGGYVWAHMGFELERGGAEFNEDLDRRLGLIERYGGLSDDLQKAVDDIRGLGGVMMPYRLSNLDQPVDRKLFDDVIGLNLRSGQVVKPTLGKLLLIGTSGSYRLPAARFHVLKEWASVRKARDKGGGKGTISIADLIMRDLERKVGKGHPEFDENQPRDEQGRWSGGSGGSIPWSRTEGRAGPPLGQPFVVYRVGSKEGGLAARNAGNAQGVAYHLARADDLEAPSSRLPVGGTVTAYRVVVHEAFGPYSALVGGAGERGTAVGFSHADGNSVFSFPSIGSWEASPIASVSLADIRAELKRSGYASFDESGSHIGGQVISRTFGRLPAMRSTDARLIDFTFDKLGKGNPEFDPDQPRDENSGRWSGGGASLSTREGNRDLGGADSTGEAIALARIRARDRNEDVIVQRKDGEKLVIKPDGSVLVGKGRPEYRDDQPRDEGGRWAGGSGGDFRGLDDKWPNRGTDDSNSAVNDLRKTVDFMAQFEAQSKQRGYNTLMKESARSYKFDDKSFQGNRSTQHKCYQCAGQKALYDSNLTYVEGYISVHGVPIEHAWVVDKDGRVIDPTLKDGKGVKAYLGIPLQTEYLREAILRTKHWGMISYTTNRDIFTAKPETYVAKFGKGLPEFDPDQPRDEAGRWTSSGAYQTSGKDIASRDIQRGLSRIPEEHRELLRRRGVKFYVVDKIGGGESYTDAGTVLGLTYLGIENKVFIARTASFIWKGKEVNLPLLNVEGMVVHEIGHAIDGLFGPLSSALEKYIDEDARKMTKKELQDAWYFFSNRYEKFAELYRVAYARTPRGGIAEEGYRAFGGMERGRAKRVFGTSLRMLKALDVTRLR